MATDSKRSPKPKHDASCKSLFAHRRTVEDTLRTLAAELARTLDFATLRRMPASFVTEHLGRRDCLQRLRHVCRVYSQRLTTTRIPPMKAPRA